MLAPTLLHTPQHSSNKAFLFTAIGWLVSGGGGSEDGNTGDAERSAGNEGAGDLMP